MGINNIQNIRDGYKEFFELCSQEDFFRFGLSKIITIENDKIKEDWNKLKWNIENKGNDLYIRDFGRNGIGNSYLEMMYKDVFDISINFDPTNNTKPTQKIQKLTEYRKNKTIYNYQVSHIFGNTKNVYCFTAPWNIVFIPKILDPFTGHEAKGTYVNEFRNIFTKKYFELFHDYIDDYHSLLKAIMPDVNNWINKNINEERIKISILKEFKEIKNCI